MPKFYLIFYADLQIKTAAVGILKLFRFIDFSLHSKISDVIIINSYNIYELLIIILSCIKNGIIPGTWKLFAIYLFPQASGYSIIESAINQDSGGETVCLIL